MEPRIVTEVELAQEKAFKSKIKEMEIRLGKPIRVSLWKGLELEVIFENGMEFDLPVRDQVFALHRRVFA